jgi:hypothetical protein
VVEILRISPYNLNFETRRVSSDTRPKGGFHTRNARISRRRHFTRRKAYFTIAVYRNDKLQFKHHFKPKTRAPAVMTGARVLDSIQLIAYCWAAILSS